MNQEDLDRFYERVEVRGDCWIWVGKVGRDRKGRTAGRFYMSRGVDRPAHRVAWEHFIGPLTLSDFIHHTCGSRLCVNPVHLTSVSRSSVTAKARKTQLARTTCKYGHPYDYVTPNGVRGCKTCRKAASQRRRLRLKAQRKEQQNDEPINPSSDRSVG